MDNLLYDTPDVSIALSLHPLALCSQYVSKFRELCGRRTYEVERAELGGVLVQAGVGREDRAATLTLVANDPTHDDGVDVSWLSVVGVHREEYGQSLSETQFRTCVGLAVCALAPEPPTWERQSNKAVVSIIAKVFFFPHVRKRLKATFDACFVSVFSRLFPSTLRQLSFLRSLLGLPG